MTTTILIDANNYFRRLIETDNTGFPVRSIYGLVTSSLIHKGNVIVVWDGYKGNSKRQAIFPSYKEKRFKPNESLFETFKMIEEILAFAPVLQIKMPEYEADDVIANLARYSAKKNETVMIYSGDYDFMQLAAEFPENIFCGAPLKEHVTPDMVRYYKTVVGDPSDNIPGIRGFGDGAWKSLDKQRIKLFVNYIISGVDRPTCLMLPARCKYEAEDIRTYWKIVGFFDIDLTELAGHFKIGKQDPLSAHHFLKGYMQ